MTPPLPLKKCPNIIFFVDGFPNFFSTSGGIWIVSIPNLLCKEARTRTDNVFSPLSEISTRAAIMGAEL